MSKSQGALIVGAAIGFGCLFSGFKIVGKNYGTKMPVLRDFDAATNFHDPQFAASFVAGLVGSLIVLYFSFAGNKARPILNPKEWQNFNLMERKRISSNTSLYRFRLPRTDNILGLPIGQHISLQAEIDGKNVMRSYTPTSSDDDLGFFDLIVKTYPNGNISKVLDELRIGEPIQVRGPKGQMKYSPDLAKKIGMIAGGTGFTPCLQIIRAALKDPNDKTQIDFIYANVNEEDILLKEELDRLALQHADRFRVIYFLNNPPEGWKGETGFVSKEAIQEKLPGPKEEGIKIMMCGPPPMMKACQKHLEELGYQKPRAVSKLEDQVFCF